MGLCRRHCRIQTNSKASYPFIPPISSVPYLKRYHHITPHTHKSHLVWFGHDFLHHIHLIWAKGQFHRGYLESQQSGKSMLKLFTAANSGNLPPKRATCVRTESVASFGQYFVGCRENVKTSENMPL